MKKITRISLIGGGAAIALVAGASSGMAIAAATQPTEAAIFETSVNGVESFKTNANGQTYGWVDQGLLDDPSARATLVGVVTDDGKEGWAYTSELMPWLDAKTPEEAASLTTDQPYAVAVYALDGKTLLGYHTVNRPPEP